MKTLQITEPKARKDHTCDYCGFKIEKGEKYQKSTHIDGDLYTWKAHLSCQELAEKMGMFKDCPDGVTDHDFLEIVNDYYSGLPDYFENSDWRYILEKVKNIFKLKNNEK